MDDETLIAIISQGITDGTDLDCTPETQAREVLRQLRAAGVIADADLVAEVAEWKQATVAFAGPWAAQYARDFGLPDGHLHPTHYDILQRAGARMDGFIRHGDTQCPS